MLAHARRKRKYSDSVRSRWRVTPLDPDSPRLSQILRRTLRPAALLLGTAVRPPHHHHHHHHHHPLAHIAYWFVS
ncbi:hypothetical protein E2C01_028752 [Portunus trituberculatus]|uniref:Uncharacterized protein n=1 Tax=Portunus trituberculatus TaxID=210409 RepID=A0A5B7ELA4_PORTR|nr:hypothetical protein [Portunus trituberculatus]